MPAASWLASAQVPQPDDFHPVSSGQVYALAVQSDGKILVGGEFTSLAGQPRTNLARLNADGSLDVIFDPRPNGRISALVVQEDGRILVGGSFSQIAGRLRDNLARLHHDGTLDTSFVARTDGEVRALALQPDGKIIVAGQFNALNNYWSYRSGRLYPDGTKDAGFSLDSNSAGAVLAVAVQAEGKVLIGGTFGQEFSGYWRYRIARWNADGTLDYGFNPGEFSHNDAAVNALAIQPDGRILAGGTFTNMAGRACYRIARITAGGAFDSSFGSGADAAVNAFALQADGKIVVAGTFTTMNGQPRSRLARFNADGTLDDSFNAGASGSVDALALQADGKALIAGNFTNLASQPRTNLARLNATSPAKHSLSRSGAEVTWLRGGTSPEVGRTVFDASTDGVLWTRLGAGNTVVGGWQITNVSASVSATIRAQGFATSGLGNGSGGLVEEFFGPPLVLTQPVSQTNNAGTTATFTSRAGGSEALSLQWRRNGSYLAEGGKFTGTQTTTLSITNVQQSDEGAFTLVASNSFGSVTSLVATLTVLDPGITTQPLSQNRELGDAAIFSVVPAGTAPFSFQWQKDGVPLPGAVSDTLTLTNLLATDAGLYAAVVCNALGCITSAPALLTVNAATLDTAFDAGTGDNAVYALVPQPDGKLLVGGSFYPIGGQPLPSFARLNANGSADTSFSPGIGGTMVTALAYLPDRSMLLGGGFSALGGATRYFFGKLTPDCLADAAFTNFPNGSVFCFAVQPDGAIPIGGWFTTFGGQPHTNLARLNADGSLDAGFNPDANGLVHALAVRPDGRLLVGGSFTTLNGQPRTNLAQLNPDGSLDPTFRLDAASEDFESLIFAFAPQPDGKFLVGGVFSTLGGQPRANLARLNADGSLDDSFRPAVSETELWLRSSVASIAVQCDGKILIGGTFNQVNGQPRQNLARLNADGTLAPTFNPGVGGQLDQVFGVTLEGDGQILVGGTFTSAAGVARTNLIRFNNTGPATDSLSRDGSTLTWLRGGTGPEVTRTTFEHTSDGIAWTALGNGTRVAGGWQLRANPPAGGTLRARGFFAASHKNSSSGYVETLLGAPVFTTQPVSRTNNAETTATFSLLATGPEPLSFQWLKDGLPLADGPAVTGATIDTLTLAGVLKAAEGSYRLVVSNPSGSVTSLVATLTVIDPVITGWPVSRYAEPGQSVTFSVSAVGTALNYQWWKDGVALPLATAASLSFTNVQLSDAGAYRVVVTNPFANVTSAVATLTVNLATLDTNFTPAANLSVSAVALQADGKTLLGGTFTTLAGSTRLRLGRLNANGTLDTTFNPQPNATVYCLAVQPDGKVLVGGDFTTLAGTARTAIGRLNTNGTLDTGFTTTFLTPPPGQTLTARAQAILLQPDGKIVVGGRVAYNGGIATGFISRLNTNGTTDVKFDVTFGVNGPVATLALQADGKIVVGGLFSLLRNLPRNRLGRLNADGTLDTNFTANADNTVLTLAVQSDGRILVGGSFNSVASQPRTNLARLNANGTLDPNFVAAATGTSSASVYSLALQADGKIVVGGLFNAVAGQPRANFARLNADGTLDAGANPGPNNYVYGLAIQTDAKIVAAGEFTQIGSQSRSRIARLSLPEPATQTLGYNGATLTWQRGGSSPEVGRTSFEFSTNLTTWSLLGAGTRIAGGWELGGLSLLPAGRIRARGVAVGGGFNASTWFLEATLAVDPNAPPSIVTSDGSFGFDGGRFGFNFAGLIGQGVVVEGSTNLSNWVPLATNWLSTDYGHFTDPDSTNHAGRFYRARLK